MGSRRAEVAQQRDKLHAAQKGFSSIDDIEQFLSDHAGLRKDDLDACQSKLAELQAAVKLAEKEERERLQQLYEVTGIGDVALEAFFASLEASEINVEERKQALNAEIARVEEYYESIKGVLTQLNALKALVVEGAQFEGTAQGGDNR